MSPNSDNGKDGIIAKAAGVVVLGGAAWTLYKSFGPLFFRPKGHPYEILHGDTLFSISQTTGVSIERLKSVNGMNRDDIYAGEIMIIPK